MDLREAVGDASDRIALERAGLDEDVERRQCPLQRRNEVLGQREIDRAHRAQRSCAACRAASRPCITASLATRSAQMERMRPMNASSACPSTRAITPSPRAYSASE